MKKKKLIFSVVLLLVLSSIFLQRVDFSANAEEYETEISNELSPRGLYAKLQLAIDGGDGTIIATVKNVFTLFPSTVNVIVELYSSEERQESYTAMTLSTRNSTLDLDQGETISTTASTEGKTLWWTARMRYKINFKDWEERVTNIIQFDGLGNFIEI